MEAVLSADLRDLAAEGWNVRFYAVSGEVLDTEQRSDTYVSGQTTGATYKGTGGVTGHVTSKVVVQRDIWVKTDDGKEDHFRFEQDIPCRTGQRITVLWAVPNNQQGGPYIFLYNHNTQTFYDFPKDEWLAPLVKPFGKTMNVIAVGALALFVAGYIFSPILGAIAAIAAGTFMARPEKARMKADENSISFHVSKIKQSVQSS